VYEGAKGLFGLGYGWICSGIFGTLLAISVWIYGSKLDETRTELEAWKASSHQNIKALEESNRAFKALNTLLSVREHELENARANYQSVQARLEEVFQNDKDSQKWSNARIPSSVLSVLCKPANSARNNHH